MLNKMLTNKKKKQIRASEAAAADSQSSPRGPGQPMPPRAWFFTFMCMNIPIAGWIYLLGLGFGRKESQLRDFARAYLLYKLVFLAIALVLLVIMVCIGLDLADKVLTYMEML